MNLVTTLWSMQAAAALTLAVLYGVVWNIDRRNLANLAVCIVAVAMAVAAREEVGMMHAATVTEYGEWARLLYLPLFFALVGQLFLVRAGSGCCGRSSAHGWWCSSVISSPIRSLPGARSWLFAT